MRTSSAAASSTSSQAATPTARATLAWPGRPIRQSGQKLATYPISSDATAAARLRAMTALTKAAMSPSQIMAAPLSAPAQMVAPRDTASTATGNRRRAISASPLTLSSRYSSQRGPANPVWCQDIDA